MITIKAPLEVPVKVRKKARTNYVLNCNTFFHLFWQKKDQVKTMYYKMLKDQLEGLKLDYPIAIEYVLHKSGNKGAKDRANALAVHDKCFCDALQEFNCIPNDDDFYISWQEFHTGENRTTDPCVMIYIHENVKPKYRGN